MQTIPSEWMDEILAETASLCLAEVGGADAPLGADNSGTETSRHEDVERPDRDARGFVEKPRKAYRKYRIIAVMSMANAVAAAGPEPSGLTIRVDNGPSTPAANSDHLWPRWESPLSTSASTYGSRTDTPSPSTGVQKRASGRSLPTSKEPERRCWPRLRTAATAEYTLRQGT